MSLRVAGKKEAERYLNNSNNNNNSENSREHFRQLFRGGNVRLGREPNNCRRRIPPQMLKSPARCEEFGNKSN